MTALILVDAAGLPGRRSPPLAFRLASMPVLSRLLAKLGTHHLVEKTVNAVYADPLRIPDEVRRRYFELARREGNRTSFGQRM